MTKVVCPTVYVTVPDGTESARFGGTALEPRKLPEHSGTLEQGPLDEIFAFMD